MSESRRVRFGESLPSLSTLARIAAAILGGYLCANAAALALAALLPLAESDAVMTGMLLSFALYCCAVIYAFSSRSAYRAWTDIAGCSLLFLLLAWLFGAIA